MIRVATIYISTIILILSVFSGAFHAVVAMHDSHLDVNTWIASDNVTEVHTMDLNNGPVSPSSAIGETTPDGEEDAGIEEESVEEEQNTEDGETTDEDNETTGDEDNNTEDGEE